MVLQASGLAVDLGTKLWFFSFPDLRRYAFWGFAHICIHKYSNTYIYIYIHTCIMYHVCIYIYILYIHVCTYVRTYLHTYIHYITLHYIPRHYIPYYSIPFHTITYHTILYHYCTYHSIPYYTIPFHSIPYTTHTHTLKFLDFPNHFLSTLTLGDAATSSARGASARKPPTSSVSPVYSSWDRWGLVLSHRKIPKWLSQKTKTYHTKLYLVGGFNMSNIRRKNCAEPLPHHRPYVWYCMVYVLPLRRMHIFPFGLQFKPYLVFVYWCWWYINIIPDLDGLCVLGTHQNRATRKSCRLLSIKLAVFSPSRSV